MREHYTEYRVVLSHFYLPNTFTSFIWDYLRYLLSVTMNDIIYLWFVDIAVVISGVSIADCFAKRLEYLQELR